MTDLRPAPCASCRTPVIEAVSVHNGDRQWFDAAPAPDGAWTIRPGYTGLVATRLTTPAARFGRPRLYQHHPTPCRRRPAVNALGVTTRDA